MTTEQLKRHHKRQPSAMAYSPSSYTALVTLPSNVSLELLLKKPTSNITNVNNKLAFLLHPWSWLGGCMYDPYVQYFQSLSQPESNT